MTYWSTPRCRLLGDQILDEARAGHDGGAERPRALRVHVAAVAPALVRRRQLQADLVLEHVRRRIDLDVQRAPQGDPHRRAVGCYPVVACAGISPSRSVRPSTTSS